jgi:tRNA modification GTPase
MKQSSVFLVRLTPAGRGGVATLLLTGVNAKDIFLLRFISATDLCRLSCSPLRPYFGKLRLDETDQFEEVVARIIDSDNVEIHCHGGNMIFTAIEQSFARDGVVTKNHIDPADKNSQRELALRLLPLAATERVAQILLDQYHGAMERELAEIGKLTAIVDQNIANETIESNTDQKTQIELEQLQFQLQRRLNRIEENRWVGQHLIKPFRVILTGKTNVGKSSLFNAILGYNRAITSPLSGTTRDVVVAQTAIDGFPVAIYDSAGINNFDANEIEEEGIKRSMELLEEVDLVIRVIDLSAPDNNLYVGDNVTKNTLTCYNKADLPVDLVDGICVSAKTGEGIADLIEKIARTLIPNPPTQHEPVPLTNPYHP